MTRHHTLSEDWDGLAKKRETFIWFFFIEILWNLSSECRRHRNTSEFLYLIRSSSSP
jgi:hypothetical protein